MDKVQYTVDKDAATQLSDAIIDFVRQQPANILTQYTALQLATMGLYTLILGFGSPDDAIEANKEILIGMWQAVLDDAQAMDAETFNAIRMHWLAEQLHESSSKLRH